MAIAHDPPKEPGLLTRVLTTDFCPWANRFVYWLKEPVGWFTLATVVCVIIGLYFSPIGWTLAASLASVIAVGMVWPAVAVRVVACKLSPKMPQVHEDDRCELLLAVRNRMPLPVWGLAVEGYLDRKREVEDEKGIPTVALAFVRALATSTYRFSIHPELRGRYPDGDATLTCSFPFGIWTAKRKLIDVSPVTVWPKVFPIAGETAMTGRQTAEVGEGNRSGRTGDFLGVREYRQGDCRRQVNWVATARLGELVVTERSGPQCPNVELTVDTGGTPDQDELSDRIRIAASVFANLHQSGMPLRFRMGREGVSVRRGWEGFAQVMDRLAEVPADGLSDQPIGSVTRTRTVIVVSSNDGGDVVVSVKDPTVNRRSGGDHSHRVICRDRDLAEQMLAFWTEVRDANLVA